MLHGNLLLLGQFAGHLLKLFDAGKLLDVLEAEAEQEGQRARDSLRNAVAELAVKGAEQILKREVNAGNHAELLNQLKAQL